jgi:hypothetical protein
MSQSCSARRTPLDVSGCTCRVISQKRRNRVFAGTSHGITLRRTVSGWYSAFFHTLTPRIVSSRAMATGPTWSGSGRRSSLTRHVRHSQGVLQPLCRCTLSSANDAVALRLRYSAAATWTGLGETGLALPIPGRAAAAPCCLCSPSGVALHAVVADGGYTERWIMAEHGQVPAAGMVLEAGNLGVLHDGCPA